MAVQRLLLGDKVAAAKFGTAVPIEDPVHEGQLLAAVQRLSLAAGIDPVLGVRFFEDQIEANKYIQAGLHERWTANPALRPRQRPDLSIEVRPRLDELTGELFTQLAAGRCAKPDEPPDCALDDLHREALQLAMRSVPATRTDPTRGLEPLTCCLRMRRPRRGHEPAPANTRDWLEHNLRVPL
ncbi:hypothetical protein GCM10027097_02810 [Amycolatopsis acidiphila]